MATMNVAQTAAVAAAALIAGVAVFQLALALGAPYGNAVFGGKAPTEQGVLTGPFRALAVVQAIVLVLLGGFLLARTEALDIPILGSGALSWMVWVFVALLGVYTGVWEVLGPRPHGWLGAGSRGGQARIRPGRWMRPDGRRGMRRGVTIDDSHPEAMTTGPGLCSDVSLWAGAKVMGGI
jgi:hypothetical protein